MDLPFLASSGQSDNLITIALILAVMIVSIPMIIVHEIGHLIAARLMGIRIFEFNIGTGKILWRKTIRGIDFIIRSVPLSGHVRDLRSNTTSRLSLFVYIAGGPVANLLVAVGVSWCSSINIGDIFRDLSFPSIIIGANLWIALQTLFPLANNDGSSVASGSDGWQMWRILCRKPCFLEPSEIDQLHRNLGLEKLNRHIHSKRVIRRVMSYFVILMSLVFAIFTVFIARALIKISMDDSADIGALCAVGALSIVTLGSLGLGIFSLRKASTQPADIESMKKFNPIRRLVSDYRLLIMHKAENWNFNLLPEQIRQKIVTAHENRDSISFLYEIRDKWPDQPIIGLMLYDSLMGNKRYNDAEVEISKVLKRDDLPQILSFHFQSCELAARVCASPDDLTIERCQNNIDSVNDEGMKMWRLITLSSALTTAKHTDRLDQANKWCDQAREIYPYDAALDLQQAIIQIDKNDLNAAKLCLKSASKIADQSDEIKIRAWTAIAAALDKDPVAEKLIRQSLKESLPFVLKEHLEEAQLSLIS